MQSNGGVRAAIVRGSSQRNYELALYEFGDPHVVDVFVNKRLQLGEHSPWFNVKRLPAITDLTASLGPRSHGLLDVTAGPIEYLLGLERALDGYDIAHSFEVTTPVTVQAVRARRAGRVKRVIATVDENIPLKPFINPLVTRRMEAAAAGVDHFIPISQRSKLHLTVLGVPEDRITVMPGGTDVEVFRPAQERRPGPLRVMSSARLEPAKGVEDLVIAVGMLAQRGIDCELQLVGDGPMRSRLEHVARHMGIRDRLSFLAVPWVDMPDRYRDADVFVLASAPTRNWREQFGFALIEAMATGLPALVGASGALPEVVGRDDVLVQPHDPYDLAAKLEPLLTDGARRRELGEFNRQFALEHYDQRKIRRRLLEIYAATLAREPRD